MQSLACNQVYSSLNAKTCDKRKTGDGINQRRPFDLNLVPASRFELLTPRV